MVFLKIAHTHILSLQGRLSCPAKAISSPVSETAHLPALACRPARPPAFAVSRWCKQVQPRHAGRVLTKRAIRNDSTGFYQHCDSVSTPN